MISSIEMHYQYIFASYQSTYCGLLHYGIYSAFLLLIAGHYQLTILLNIMIWTFTGDAIVPGLSTAFRSIIPDSGGVNFLNLILSELLCLNDFSFGVMLYVFVQCLTTGGTAILAWLCWVYCRHWVEGRPPWPPSVGRTWPHCKVFGCRRKHCSFSWDRCSLWHINEDFQQLQCWLELQHCLVQCFRELVSNLTRINWFISNFFYWLSTKLF